MLERARARADATGVEGIELTEADITALPFDDGTFDLCISFNGLHCLPDQRSALAEVGRVIKPGGELRGTAVVHGEGARHDGIIRLFRRISAFGETTTADQLTTLLGDAGLEDVRVELSGALAHFHASKPTSH
jgi:ubiquinone/menaquinone biosynthesis C-methylase UbiE